MLKYKKVFKRLQICYLTSITTSFIHSKVDLSSRSSSAIRPFTKMLSLITLTALLATLTAAIPYPPEATVKPPVPAHPAHFGNKHGNFQHYNATSTPTRALSDIVARAKGGVVTGGAKVTTINNNDGIGAGQDRYITYYGDGSETAGWPKKESWVSFEQMFNANKAIMFSSCGWNGWGANDNGGEVGAIYDAIQQIAIETSVDHRFILAIIIQESGGCVRVRCFVAKAIALLESFRADRM
jgi:hypothetical protein